MKYQFSDLVAIPDIQQILDSFYSASRIPAEILDLESQIILASAGKNIIHDFQSDLALSRQKHWWDEEEIGLRNKAHAIRRFEYFEERLFEYARPVHIEDMNLAVFSLGPVFHAPPDEDWFRRLVDESPFDQAGYLETLRRLPIVAEQQAKAYLDLLVQVAQRLAGNGLKEQHFRVALLDTPVTVFNQDLDLRYTWVYNAQSFANQSMVGKTDEELFSPEDAMVLTALKQRVIGAGLLTREEISLTWGDKTYYYDMTLDPLYNSQGEITGITCAAMDITRRKLIEDQMQRRLVESESIKRITKGLLQKIGLDEVLEIVCTEAMHLTAAKGSAVLLLEEGNWLQLTHRVGSPVYKLDRLPVEGSFAGIAIQSGRPVWVNRQNKKAGDMADQLHGYPWTPGLNSLLSVPLKVDDQAIGVLNILDKSSEITEEDIRIIELFADQAAMIIEHVRLQRQAEQYAVLKERQRMARELHDSVTQALYSVTLYTDAARMAFTAQRWEALEKNLQEVRTMAREAMYDMRLLVFELHPYLLDKEGLVAALRARLAAVEGRAGLRTEVLVDNERRLPINIEEELYRIAQEGLNNVVKHAQAREVQIHLGYEEDHVLMEMIDDGQGFDREAAGRHGGMGLRGIEERVQHLNGYLEINSTAGKGTHLIIKIPLQ